MTALVLRQDGTVDASVSTSTGPVRDVYTRTHPQGCQITETIEGSINRLFVSATNGITSLVFGITGTHTTAGTWSDGSGCYDIGTTTTSANGTLFGLSNCNALKEVRSVDGKLIALNFKHSESGTIGDDTFSCTNTGRLVLP